MKTMTWLKIKFAVGFGVASLVAVGVATVSISQTSSPTTNENDGLTVQKIAQQSQEAYAALTSYSDAGKVVVVNNGQTQETTFSIRLKRPNFFRVEWSRINYFRVERSHTTGFYTSKGVAWSDGQANYFVMGAAVTFDSAKAEKMKDPQMALASAGGVSSGAASAIPGTFFSQNWGDQLKLMAMPLADVNPQRFTDEKIGDTDCYVIQRSLAPMDLPHGEGTSGTNTTRLWIGKQDHLIHQIQTTSEGASVNLNLTDQNVKSMLQRQGKAVTPETMAEMRATLKTNSPAPQGGTVVFTQTHENIAVNPELTDADFQR